MLITSNRTIYKICTKTLFKLKRVAREMLRRFCKIALVRVTGVLSSNINKTPKTPADCGRHPL